MLSKKYNSSFKTQEHAIKMCLPTRSRMLPYMLYLINFALCLNRSHLKGLGYKNLKNDSRKKIN